MPRSVVEVAASVQELMRRQNKDVLTFSWPEWYEVVERKRIKDAFTSELEEAFRSHCLLLCHGQAIVLVAKDFKFSPSA